jgi:hypothetical protein
MTDREFPGSSGEDLASFASYRDFLLGRKEKHTVCTLNASRKPVFIS